MTSSAQTLKELYNMQMQRNRMLFEAKEEIESVQQLDEVIRLTKGNLLLYIGTRAPPSTRRSRTWRARSGTTRA